jgi:hypothetical protein
LWKENPRLQKKKEQKKSPKYGLLHNDQSSIFHFVNEKRAKQVKREALERKAYIPLHMRTHKKLHKN